RIQPGCGNEDVVHQVHWRFNFLERLQPVAPFLGLCPERPTQLAAAGVSLEALPFGAGQNCIHGVAQDSVELGALHSVMEFTWHQITCLYVRWRRRASSARPRLILDFTVPSGTFRASAISR